MAVEISEGERFKKSGVFVRRAVGKGCQRSKTPLRACLNEGRRGHRDIKLAGKKEIRTMAAGWQVLKKQIGRGGERSGRRKRVHRHYKRRIKA